MPAILNSQLEGAIFKMMLLSLEQVQHIARLARIELTEEELINYRSQLSTILDYFQRLQKIDTENVPPAVSDFDLKGKLRTDQPTAGLELDEALQNASQIKNKTFRVPPVFD
jgi:aspartyl-tRNA(Asn)/glutamyl-tRNA(Gln) amidotransferase subunit C